MYHIFKRILDVLIASTALIILSPLFLVVSILLKFSGEGHVFYFQERIGYPNKYFHIWKFATMLKDSPNIGTGMITVRNDPRLTKFGGFLRKTKINELPQIFNVLRGEMSIVGPRPTVQKHYEAYDEKTRLIIYNNKPGITGVGSIIFRDEEELLSKHSEDPFAFYKKQIVPYKAKLELWYAANKSIVNDLLIILLTAWVIIFSKSALQYKVFKDLPKRTF